MAMDRFLRYKALRLLWGRARALLAALGMPHVRAVQARAARWQVVNVAERQIADGIIRGTGDPDSATRPLAQDNRAFTAPRPVMGQAPSHETERQRQEWSAAHQQWLTQQAWAAASVQQRRGR